MNAWKRVMPGVYESRIVLRISVRTYCECSYPNCMMKWAVYLDDEPIDSEYYCTRAEATASANEMIGAI
jgi:hypothetical protein